MPYSDQILLFLLGGILSYAGKTIFGNSDIKSIKNDIATIKEALIRNETMRDDIEELKRQVDELYNSRNDILLTLAKCPCDKKRGDIDE